jgi:hypothetical protein
MEEKPVGKKPVVEEHRPYVCETADRSGGAKDLIEKGYEYVCVFDQKAHFRKKREEPLRLASLEPEA